VQSANVSHEYAAVLNTFLIKSRGVNNLELFKTIRRYPKSSPKLWLLEILLPTHPHKLISPCPKYILIYYQDAPKKKRNHSVAFIQKKLKLKTATNFSRCSDAEI